MISLEFASRARSKRSFTKVTAKDAECDGNQVDNVEWYPRIWVMPKPKEAGLTRNVGDQTA